MKTKSLIYNIFYLIVFIIIGYNITVDDLFVVFCVLLIGASIILIYAFIEGEFDPWFAKHTDPIIDKITKFFNRRNIKKNENS
jgi:hypothetical protein